MYQFWLYLNRRRKQSMLKQENKMNRDRIGRQQKQDSLKKKMKTSVFRFLDARKEKAF